MRQGDKSSVSIIIDTNVWISFLMGKTLARLENYIYNGHFQIISCDEQLAELREVLYRPKMERYFSVHQIKEVFELLADFAQFVSLQSSIDICRDAKDNFLLALSIDSNANFLITGDKDLLAIKGIERTKIVSFKEFESFFLSRELQTTSNK